MDRWLLKAVSWARNPPSPARVKFVLIIIAICVAIVLVEKYIGWPDWLNVNKTSRRGILK